MASTYTDGQDVVVESEEILEGEAFLATVSEETSFSDSTMYVELGDNFEAEVALVSTDDVVTLTEVFDAIKSMRSEEDIRRLVRDAVSEANEMTRRKV
ncbi:hypothetical protein M199_gp196 [Halogranum tailed virus 1]|uniref:Uncharacterized protein n=1 Tax=Halogranum tailed virus 1 TaxID=1273749 RepID=R4T987_9CAUD|nr:hypothetical protein M199_gp196 [Halogranum tailed virus 1]AGM11470.1 hypothetical protein HGTV1_173 [Halogranum tailed virus 1]